MHSSILACMVAAKHLAPLRVDTRNHRPAASAAGDLALRSGHLAQPVWHEDFDSTSCLCIESQYERPIINCPRQIATVRSSPLWIAAEPRMLHVWRPHGRHGPFHDFPRELESHLQVNGKPYGRNEHSGICHMPSPLLIIEWGNGDIADPRVACGGSFDRQGVLE